MNINLCEYRNKVLGCWLGKNIGGTLGAPFEWRRQINDVNFYSQDLKGEPLPNDDLDIQLLWLVALEEKGVEIDAKRLAEYWLLYVTPHWAEYGTAKANMRSGLPPPLSGTHNNVYKDSCGAFIRSEIWACIAPGNPRLAVKFAYEDAILDHGNGEGVYGEVFMAVLESAAFVEGDIAKLIGVGLSYIPADCGVAGAVRCAIDAYESGKTWKEARDEILAGFRGSVAFNSKDCICEEDSRKGFAEGKLGWDVPSNIAIVVTGLLYGEGDFSETLCTAVNCGEDTDCTGATVGSILGILGGADGIPQKWIKPIGGKINTACLNLGELGFLGSLLPADVEALTDRTERIARQVISHYDLPVGIAPEPTDLAGLDARDLLADDPESLYKNKGGPVYRFDFFDVGVDYGSGPTATDGVPKRVVLRITNTYKVQENVNVRWYAPDGWRVGPSRTAKVFVGAGCLPNTVEVGFELESDAAADVRTRFVVELTIDGRPTVMLVPVVLVGGAADKVV